MRTQCVLDDVYRLPPEKVTKFVTLSSGAWREYLNEISGDAARQKVVADKLQDDYWQVFLTLFDPHQYIEPGEYRYCHQGWHLLWDHTGACDVCNRTGRSGDGMLEHSMLVEERLALAIKRFREGLSPIYWMKK